MESFLRRRLRCFGGREGSEPPDLYITTITQFIDMRSKNYLGELTDTQCPYLHKARN